MALTSLQKVGDKVEKGGPASAYCTLGVSLVSTM